MRRHVRLVTVGLLLLVGSACTSGFVYNRLETLSYWYFANLVTLDDTQAQSLRSSLGRFFAWHRESELPRYADFAESIAKEGLAPVPRARIDAIADEMERLWRDVARKAAPDAARWLTGLTPQQRTELFASLGEKDDDLREEYCEADPTKTRKRRERSFISSVESWTGKLDTAQRDLVRRGLAGLPASACGWAESRIAARAAFRTLLERNLGTPQFAAQLETFMTRPEQNWTPEYRQQFARSRATVITALADLDQTLTKEQRAKRAEKLGELAADLRKIHAAGQKPPT